MSDPEPTVFLSVKVRPGLKEELRKLGEPQQRDLSAEVRLALESWVQSKQEEHA